MLNISEQYALELLYEGHGIHANYKYNCFTICGYRVDNFIVRKIIAEKGVSPKKPKLKYCRKTKEFIDTGGDNTTSGMFIS